MTIFTRTQLRESGATDRQIARLIAGERLIRLRGGVYAEPHADASLQAACRVGGRLACASELRRLGAWILDDGVHVHLTDSPRAPSTVVRHWGDLVDIPALASVSPLDAVVQVLGCLDRSAAVAAADSALNLGLVSRHRLLDLRMRGAARRRILLLDGRAESGLESIARLIARDLRLTAAPQVSFRGVGRVDLVLEGHVVVEADGDRFHTDPASRRRDRRRDAELMARGFPVLRFGYEQLVGRPGEVARAMIHAVAGHRGVKDSGSKTRRAMARAEERGWA